MLTPSSQRSRKKIHLLGLGILANAGCVPGYQSTPIPPCFFADDPDPACQSGQGHEGSGTSDGVPTTGTTFPGNDSSTEGAEGQGTGDGTDTSEVDADTATSGSGSESTGPLVVPEPEIVDLDLDPDAPKSAGPVTVTVQAANAVEVWMTVDGGGEVALAPVGDEGTEFVGEIAVLGESWNGLHTVSAVARAGELESLPWEAMFTVTAPTAGLEVWKKKSSIVPSYGNAIAVDQNNEVYELFTESSLFGERCHLRRRDVMGNSVWPGDTRVLAPGPDCVGEDVKVAPDGTVWVLVNTWNDGIKRWRLFHLGSDGVELDVGSDVGDVHEVAGGLDVNADGDVLLCGTRPATMQDDDAWIRLVPAFGDPWTRDWDYPPLPNKKHTINEKAKDCAFVEDRIVVVGEAFGFLDLNLNIAQDRGFVLELTRSGVELAAAVSPPSPAWQSGHDAVAPDGSGYVTVGDICDKQDVPCAPNQGIVRWFALGGTLEWEVPVPAAVTVVDVATSPAGYVVVAARGVDQTKGFLMQAWSDGDAKSTWDYQGAPSVLQAANGIAVGPWAHVFVVGFYLDADVLASGVVKLHPL
jgi:hypothetical protein